MATTATPFPAEIAPESLLPILTTQLGSELLARDVIKTLQKAAEDEARKRRQAALMNIPAGGITLSPSMMTIPEQSSMTPINTSSDPKLTTGIENTVTLSKLLSPVTSMSVGATPSPASTILVSSNFLNVSSQSASPISTIPRASPSIKRPSPCTSVCSIKSSSTITSDKPFPVNQRGRKRVYTDEERRLRKNFSSKKSREKHTEKVMEKRLKLQSLQERHKELIEKRLQLEKEIQEHRSQLCPYCLNVVEEALREIGKGQDIVVLKRVNFCCSTYHANKRLQEQATEDPPASTVLPSSAGNNLVEVPPIKQEPSEFTQ